MRRIQHSKTVLAATALITALVVGACDSRSSASMNPIGPSPMAGHLGSTGTMGSMAGMGMGMAVASEFDYLTQMIPHHDEAIAAAKVLQRGTQRQEMRNFAVSIIETQTAEVKQMKEWLAAWYPGQDPYVNYMPMMRDLAGLNGDALDQAFLDDTIPHHMMAVMMSQRFVMAGLADHKDVVPFARTIRDVQHREIQMMAAWLHDWFGTAPRGHGDGAGMGGL